MWSRLSVCGRGLPLLILVSALASSGCRGKSGAPAPATSASSGALLPPLTAPAWLVPLAVAGFGSAQVSVPLGATRTRPLLIALHGQGDRPEWQCGSYRHVTRPQSFVLCPAGARRADGRGFDVASLEDTRRELRAALPALKARFSTHLSKGSVVLAALGASVDHAIELALTEPSFFARLLLVDGSSKRLSAPLATRYAQAGGKRVLFVCSAAECELEVEQRVLALRSAGVEARVLRPERGRGLDAEVVAAIAKQWEWFTRDDPRFR